MIGCIGVASLPKSDADTLNVSPGRASSQNMGIRSPALNVVFRPWERSKEDRWILALGTCENLCEPVRFPLDCKLFPSLNAAQMRLLFGCGPKVNRQAEIFRGMQFLNVPG